MKLYKVLGPDRMPHHGGSGQWPEPGEWRGAFGKLMPCINGLHLCRRPDLIHWLGPEIWEAETRGEMVEHPDKVVVREARLVRRLETWNDRTARLFACDCAEWALKRQECPDARSVEAVMIARLYAEGDATDDDLADVRAAAWESAWEATRESAWEATRESAWAAAWAATWADARAAARAATRAATWADARRWQTRRLFEYLEGKR